jgi:DNA-binding protein HU-beta
MRHHTPVDNPESRHQSPIRGRHQTPQCACGETLSEIVRVSSSRCRWRPNPGHGSRGSADPPASPDRGSDLRPESGDIPPRVWSLLLTLTGRTSKLKTSELIDHVATAAGVDVSTAKKAVDAVFAGIVEAAKKGEEVSLPSFGKFKVKEPRHVRAAIQGQARSLRLRRPASSASARQSR